MWLRLARVVAVIASAAGVLVIPPGATAKGAGTKVTVFHAFTAYGKPTLPTKTLTGYCWTGLAHRRPRRRLAVRCRERPLRPMFFAWPPPPGVVLCPSYKLTTDIEIHLTRPLPLKQADPGGPSVHRQPWLIELEASTVP